MLKWLLIAFVVGVALLLWRITAHANRNLPEPGDVAPDFSLPDQVGKARTSGEFRGKWVMQHLRHRELSTSTCVRERQNHHRHAVCQESKLDHVHAFRDLESKAEY